MSRGVLTAVLLSTVAAAVVVGVLWFVIGGWPRDHDRYGEVPIPGERTVTLPEGEVRLSFEGSVTSGGPNRILEDPPEDLRVKLASGTGEVLEVEPVSGSLYGLLSGDRGHEPFGNADVPADGRYSVRTTARGASASGAITIGPELWNPLGSPAVGAVAAALASLLALLLLELPLLLFARRRV